MSRIFHILIIATFCMLPAPPASALEQTTPDALIFVFDRPPESPTTKWLTLVYTEALNRMGIEFFLMQVPAKRGTVYTNTGQADGQLSRVYAYNTSNPEMVRVEESHFFIKFSAFSADPSIKLNSWADLRKTDFFVDYRLGVVTCEKQLPKVLDAERIFATPDMPQSFKKLLARKNTLYVDVESNVHEYMHTSQYLQNSSEGKIYKVGTMEQTSTHAFLNKRHKLLAPKLSSILKKMKAEGLFAQYRQEVGLSPQELHW